VTETLKLQTTTVLSKPCLYTGDSDSDRDSLYNSIGEVEVASVASSEKSGPNEDSAAVIPIGEDALVLVVADGVGGLPGGRNASNITVKAISDAVKKSNLADLRMAILDGIETANAKLLTSPTSSATTVAVAEIRPGVARSYHVGDSAIWVCGQRGKIKMQTIPHSPVGFAVEAGLLKETEALNHENLHLITNVVGSGEMRIEMGPELKLTSRDTILIASDGLLDNLMQHEIIRIVRKGPMDKAMDGLTQLSLKRMHEPTSGRPSKHDDYTAILYRQPRPKRKSPPKPARKQPTGTQADK